MLFGDYLKHRLISIVVKDGRLFFIGVYMTGKITGFVLGLCIFGVGVYVGTLKKKFHTFASSAPTVQSDPNNHYYQMWLESELQKADCIKIIKRLQK
jgi:hypothetical protein